MTTQLTPRLVLPPDEETSPRRPAWRRRLIDAERGISQGVRGDSTFFVHFFLTCLIVTSALVLGIPFMHWTVLILAMTVVLAAEMFHQVLKSVWEHLGHHFEEPAQKSLRMGTAAVFVTMAGASLCITIIFAQRIWQMFAG